MTDISSLKSDMRQQMKDVRAQAFKKNKNAGIVLRDQFLASISLPADRVIASYHAVGSEIDPAILTDALRAAGHRIALPVMMGKTMPLVFREHKAREGLVLNRWGIEEPGPDASSLIPDVVLVPLLAFDRRYGRLGTGAGYYDRTLVALRAKKPILAIGLAFSDQEVPEVPLEEHDALLDRIATDRGFF